MPPAFGEKVETQEEEPKDRKHQAKYRNGCNRYDCPMKPWDIRYGGSGGDDSYNRDKANGSKILHRLSVFRQREVSILCLFSSVQRRGGRSRV